MSSVDVIVPCYNYGRFLRECTQSVLTQSPCDVRVLIIDDASADDTEQVARRLMSEDRRVEYRRHSANLGHIATYNEGLQWAEAQYTVLLSADDVLQAGALERATRLMDTHPTVGFVYGRCVSIGEDGSRLSPPSESTNGPWDVRPGLQWIESVCHDCQSPVFSPEVVVRTAVQRAVGGYRHELPHSGDLEMWLRLAAHADVGVLTSEQASHRIHGQNMHLLVFDTVFKRFFQRSAAFDLFFSHYGHRLPDRERLSSLALKALSHDAIELADKAFYQGSVEACRELMGFARTCPDASSSKRFRRITWMLRVGPKIWMPLHRVVHGSERLLRGPRGIG